LQTGSVSTLMLLPEGGFDVGPDGFVYIDDPSSIQKFKPTTPGALLTVAGTGQAGSTGDGGPAIRATFGTGSLAVNPVNGDIALFDSIKYTIRVITAATGTIQTVAGAPHSSGDNGPAVLAQIQLGDGLASDASGNVYFGDNAGASIRKFSPSGIVTTVAGTGIPGNSGDGGTAALAQVSPGGGLAADSRGNLYFVNAVPISPISYSLAIAVRKIDANGFISTVAGGGTAAVANGVNASNVSLSVVSSETVTSLAVDPTGNLYLAYLDPSETARILKIDPAGNISVIAGGGSLLTDSDGTPAASAVLGNITGLAVNAAGMVYFGEGSAVHKIDSKGLLATVAGNANLPSNQTAIQAGAALSTQIGNPGPVTIDSSGNLIFCADAISSFPQVVLVDSSGNLTPIAGSIPPNYVAASAGDGGDGSKATFSSIAGLTADPAGNIYVADGEWYIRKLASYDPSATPPFLAAGGVAGAGGSIPAVLAVSPDGDATIYGKFRSVSYAGTVGPGKWQGAHEPGGGVRQLRRRPRGDAGRVSGPDQRAGPDASTRTGGCAGDAELRRVERGFEQLRGRAHASGIAGVLFVPAGSSGGEQSHRSGERVDERAGGLPGTAARSYLHAREGWRYRGSVRDGLGIDESAAWSWGHPRRRGDAGIAIHADAGRHNHAHREHPVRWRRPLLRGAVSGEFRGSFGNSQRKSAAGDYRRRHGFTASRIHRGAVGLRISH
jgi:hypothetical protein